MKIDTVNILLKKYIFRINHLLKHKYIDYKEFRKYNTVKMGQELAFNDDEEAREDIFMKFIELGEYDYNFLFKYNENNLYKIPEYDFFEQKLVPKEKTIYKYMLNDEVSFEIILDYDIFIEIKGNSYYQKINTKNLYYVLFKEGILYINNSAITKIDFEHIKKERLFKLLNSLSILAESNLIKLKKQMSNKDEFKKLRKSIKNGFRNLEDEIDNNNRLLNSVGVLGLTIFALDS